MGAERPEEDRFPELSHAKVREEWEKKNKTQDS